MKRRPISFLKYTVARVRVSTSQAKRTYRNASFFVCNVNSYLYLENSLKKHYFSCKSYLNIIFFSENNFTIYSFHCPSRKRFNFQNELK